MNRVSIFQDFHELFIINRVRVSRSGRHPYPNLGQVPPGGGGFEPHSSDKVISYVSVFLKRLENYHSSKLLIPRGVNQISTARSSQIVSGNSHGASILQPEIRLRFLRLLSLSSFTPAG